VNAKRPPGLKGATGERAAWFRDSEGNVLSLSEPWVIRPLGT